MTDEEITRLCAEAMGIGFDFDIGPPYTKGALRIQEEIRKDHKYAYAPLHDDAQAMALVKKFGLGIRKDGAIWHVGQPYAENHSLSRAICLCVAKMQAAK